VTKVIFQIKHGPYVNKKSVDVVEFLNVFKIRVIYFVFKNHPFFALEL